MARASFVLPGPLLSSLRYPNQAVHGMAAWGSDPETDRGHAWVKWDGTFISAEWAQPAIPNGNGHAAGSVRLFARWMWVEDNRFSLIHVVPSSLLADDILGRFSSISRADRPSFILLPLSSPSNRLG